MQWVCFVPGFAGSDLFRRDRYGDREVKLWLSQIDIGWNGIGELDTDEDVSPPVLERVRPGQPLYEVYQPFYAFLARNGFHVASFGYDWRTDLATNGQRLAEFFSDERTAGAEWTVIGHSMGGLIIASALGRLDNGPAQRIKRVITCGTPWHGSFRSLELLAGYHDLIQQIVSLNRVFSRRNRFQWMQEALRVVSGWDGVYDLLPMPEMMTAYPPQPGTDFRDDPVLSLVNPWYRANKYTEAVARRPLTAPPWPHISWHNFRGTGRRTSGPSPTMRDGYPDFWPDSLLGDGAVPEFSSRSPAILNATDYQFDADHEQFMSEWRVQERLLTLLEA